MFHVDEQGSAENNGVEPNDCSPLQSYAEDVCVWRQPEQAVYDFSLNFWGAEEFGERGGFLRPPAPLQGTAQAVRDIWRRAI